MTSVRQSLNTGLEACRYGWKVGAPLIVVSALGEGLRYAITRNYRPWLTQGIIISGLMSTAGVMFNSFLAGITLHLLTS